MTLPINYKLPEIKNDPTSDELNSYHQDMNFELQNMYEQIAQNVNGVFRTNLDLDGSQFKPTLGGSTVTGTFTYTDQSCYVLRQGIMTDFWFDVSWSSQAGATGDLRLFLPYKISLQSGMFFVGSCFMNLATFPAGTTSLSVTGIPNTYEASFQGSGTGVNTSPIAVYGNGRVGGYLRYIGLEDEVE